MSFFGFVRTVSIKPRWEDNYVSYIVEDTGFCHTSITLIFCCLKGGRGNGRGESRAWMACRQEWPCKHPRSRAGWGYIRRPSESKWQVPETGSYVCVPAGALPGPSALGPMVNAECVLWKVMVSQRLLVHPKSLFKGRGRLRGSRVSYLSQTRRPFPWLTRQRLASQVDAFLLEGGAGTGNFNKWRQRLFGWMPFSFLYSSFCQSDCGRLADGPRHISIWMSTAKQQQMFWNNSFGRGKWDRIPLSWEVFVKCSSVSLAHWRFRSLTFVKLFAAAHLLWRFGMIECLQEEDGPRFLCVSLGNRGQRATKKHTALWGQSVLGFDLEDAKVTGVTQFIVWFVWYDMNTQSQRWMHKAPMKWCLEIILSYSSWHPC